MLARAVSDVCQCLDIERHGFGSRGTATNDRQNALRVIRHSFKIEEWEYLLKQPDFLKAFLQMRTLEDVEKVSMPGDRLLREEKERASGGRNGTELSPQQRRPEAHDQKQSGQGTSKST